MRFHLVLLPFLSFFVLSASPPAPERYQGSLKPGAALESILPPERFMGDIGVVAFFVSSERIEKACGVGNLACVRLVDGARVIIMPNPCPLLISRKEHYAAVTCHEIGHINGWPKEHGDPDAPPPVNLTSQ